MSTASERIKQLAQKWLTGSISEEEKQEFMRWYNEANDGLPVEIQAAAGDELTHALRMYNNIYQQTGGFDKEISDETSPVGKAMNARDREPQQRGSQQKESQQSESLQRSFRQFPRRLYYYAAAAAILALLTTGYFLLSTRPLTELATIPTQTTTTDVLPPTAAQAVITLANGEQIVLDSAGSGRIAQQGNVELQKTSDGQIIYSGKGGETLINTLSNPRGSKVTSIVLSDGTRVWLNSESSLRYPVAFNGTSREVEVTGETYFEVARDPSRPFRVKKGGMELTVLGTHFNINAYDDESLLTISLLEGSVEVRSAAGGQLRMKPGEQSRLDAQGEIVLEKNADMDGVMAWKNGRFDFGEKTDIHTVMRQLARWYDLHFEFEGNITEQFGGSISREVYLSQVLKILEATGGVKFVVMEGKKVIVKPSS